MINTAILLGRVGKKEVKPMKSGGEFTHFSIATNHKYKDATGAYQEETTWHNISCFSKLAEIAAKYVHVGELVYVQGKIQNKKIEAGERAGQFAYSVIANEIKLLPNGKKSAEKEKNQYKIFDNWMQPNPLHDGFMNGFLRYLSRF
jgi:single-strand DNA-binding protein